MQPDSLTDDDDDYRAEVPRRLGPLVLLYLFLVFLLGAALQSSVNFVDYSHSNPLPPLDASSRRANTLNNWCLMASVTEIKSIFSSDST